MFPGYFFSQCSFEDKRTLTVSGHTVRFLKVENENELIDELRQIFESKRKGVTLHKHKYLEKGTKVKVVSGVLKDVIGYVEDQKNLGVVILKVKILKEAVAVNIDSQNVRIIK